MSQQLAVSHQSKMTVTAPSGVATRLVIIETPVLLRVSVTSNYFTDLNKRVKSASVLVS
jgi:hypothetical protein